MFQKAVRRECIARKKLRQCTHYRRVHGRKLIVVRFEVCGIVRTWGVVYLAFRRDRPGNLEISDVVKEIETHDLQPRSVASQRSIRQQILE